MNCHNIWIVSESQCCWAVAACLGCAGRVHLCCGGQWPSGVSRRSSHRRLSRWRHVHRTSSSGTVSRWHTVHRCGYVEFDDYKIKQLLLTSQSWKDSWSEVVGYSDDVLATKIKFYILVSESPEAVLKNNWLCFDLSPYKYHTSNCCRPAIVLQSPCPSCNNF